MSARAGSPLLFITHEQSGNRHYVCMCVSSYVQLYINTYQQKNVNLYTDNDNKNNKNNKTGNSNE